MSVAAPHAASLSFLLSQVGAERATSFARMSSSAGVSPRGYAILAALGGDEAPSQQQLSERLGIHRNNMVTLIDDLESAGLVERHRDPDDRRAFRIHRTPKGTRTVTKIGRLIAETDGELTNMLGNERARTLYTLLESLAADLGLTQGLHPYVGDAG